MVEILIFTFLKRLIQFIYAGKILSLFGQSFRGDKHCKVVTLNSLSQ